MESPNTGSSMCASAAIPWDSNILRMYAFSSLSLCFRQLRAMFSLSIELDFISSSYEDAIRKVVSWGGDVDTMGAITGAIAGAFYGVPEEIEEEGLDYLDDAMLEIVKRFKDYVKNKQK